MAQFDRNEIVEEVDECSVYVGNVEYTTTKRQLMDAFARCGRITKVTIPHEVHTKQPRGFAYVRFDSRESALKAFEMQSTMINGRPVVVKPKRITVRGYANLTWPKPRDLHGAQGLVESSAPDTRKVLILTPSSPLEELEAFLAAHPPSAMGEQGLACISIKVEMEDEQQATARRLKDIESEIKMEWERRVDKCRPDPKILRKLAVRHGYVHGKWKIYCDLGDSDSTWSVLAHAIREGRLGRCICVRPNTSPRWSHSHMISVFAEDFTCEADVMALRDTLYDLGMTQNLFLKPEIYTLCGIGSPNPWGIMSFVFMK